MRIDLALRWDSSMSVAPLEFSGRTGASPHQKSRKQASRDESSCSSELVEAIPDRADERELIPTVLSLPAEPLG
jgi:hypothetical protein